MSKKQTVTINEDDNLKLEKIYKVIDDAFKDIGNEKKSNHRNMKFKFKPNNFLPKVSYIRKKYSLSNHNVNNKDVVTNLYKQRKLDSSEIKFNFKQSKNSDVVIHKRDQTRKPEVEDPRTKIIKNDLERLI